ncbi:MAG: tetratricopeptide repeat protein, partial [Proteobacteria bacterium]|nr:tetratricopeptide repeat protein [Pseudomonadota bacterium]
MAEHMQDEADLEALKRWWDENGKGIIAAVVVAVLGTVGWQQYQGFSASKAEAASDLYATMLAIQLEQGDPEQLTALASQLKNEHGGSTYARFGAMLEARNAVEAGDLAAAEASLRWALKAGDTRSDIGQLIQLRLARVLAAAGQETEA